jgi:hypothetical protein
MEPPWQGTRRVTRAVLVAALVLWILGLGVRLRIARDWVFAGSDSYGYVKLADELRAHGRYALGPAPAPLHWARPPIYPMFILLAKGEARAEMSGGDGWMKIKRAQIALDWLAVGVLVGAMALRLAGPAAALIALALAMFWPFTVIPTAAALTESVATSLSVLAIAPLILGVGRPRRYFPLAGAGIALSTLCRPDGLLLGAALLPALWRLRDPAKPRSVRALVEPARVGLLCLGAFVAVFAPWPIRNLKQFGAAHPFGGRVDRFTQPVIHYQGYWSYLRAIAWDWVPMTSPTTCYYDVTCSPHAADLDRFDAYDSPHERAQAEALFAERNRDGLTRSVSDGFGRLADAHRRRHPFSVEVLQPISRAFHMWVAPFDELLQNPMWRPWRPVVSRIQPAFLALAVIYALCVIGGAILMLRDPMTRGGAAVLVTAMAARTAVMAYTFYCMPRYALEVMPLGFVLIAGGVSLGWPHLRGAATRVPRLRA